MRLQARSGRDVTASWMDLAVAGMALPPGVVLDGEAVVVVDGRVSFEAARSRAASTPARARLLAEEHPALLIVWDVLSLPMGDVRARPYEERRAMMLDVLAALPSPSPIQAVSAADDVEVARVRYDTLVASGVEGVIAKLGSAPYRAGRSSSRKKVRHAETTEVEVVGFTRAAAHPGRSRCGCRTGVSRCRSGWVPGWLCRLLRSSWTPSRPGGAGQAGARCSLRRRPGSSSRCWRGRRGMRW
ncbi:hypothetical protein [Streptomyces sp. NPDC021139]|uniref:ATP-dependent DNA ligase n=1 Tax=unclassified Streptomyces TaxID=2593676 RepID=UPI0033D22D0D